MRSSSILYCDFYNLGIGNIQALACDKCGFGVYMILIVHVRIQLINDGWKYAYRYQSYRRDVVQAASSDSTELPLIFLHALLVLFVFLFCLLLDFLSLCFSSFLEQIQEGDESPLFYCMKEGKLMAHQLIIWTIKNRWLPPVGSCSYIILMKPLIGSAKNRVKWSYPFGWVLTWKMK